MKLNLQPKSFFLIAGAVFVAGCGLVYMTYSNLGEEKKALEVLKADLKDEKTVQRELDEGKAKIATLKSQLSHLENGIPQAAYIPTMLDELEKYGKKNNLLILEVRPLFEENHKKDTESTKKSAYEEQSITVKGRGTYGDTMRFVDALKNFPKIVAVRSLTVTPKDSGKIEAGSPPLEFAIELRAFAFKDSPIESKPGDKTASASSEVKNES